MTKPTVVCDTECYQNYWLVSFKNVDTGKVVSFEYYAGVPLNKAAVRKILKNCRVVTFNGRNYDMPMIAYALNGATNADLKKASDAIIVGDMKPWEFERAFGVQIPADIDHIDLIEVAPGMASLKTYGGRMHSTRLQDLPIEPDQWIEEAERLVLRPYCENDLDTTIDLKGKLRQQIELREQMSEEYGIDLRSKSDAQIAEAVIRSQVSKLMGEEVRRPRIKDGTTFKYRPPSWLSYASPSLKAKLAEVVAADFVVSEGKIEMPSCLEGAKVIIGRGVYRMGIGGIHSSEQRTAHYADDKTLLVDRDVASYYPAIILNCELAPPHMGKHFLVVYRGIVDRRLAAKREGKKVVADSLKIVINGSFGKLGSMWSALYSPDLMIQVTVTGQLALLMLIERLEMSYIPVVSANTDGIVIKCPKDRESVMDGIVAWWEGETGFETEATHYKALYSRDVNNYIAVKPDGSAKTKGAYAPAGLQKNPANTISTDAVVEFLTKGTPVEETVIKCRDIRKFVTVRSVKGGGEWRGTYLGKTVRWYYAHDGSPITYVSNGNQVARSEGCKPLQVLEEEFPSDVNHAWYVEEAYSILKDIGHA